ncbi:MAG: hypothetical protein ACI88H_002086 [Cocleimonas sp.]|jgi:hypothetical protein
MAKKVAIITIHGMGDTNPNYYKSLEKKLRKYVGKSLWDDEVHLESVFYQNLLQGNQEEYWDEIDDEYKLKWDFLRKFMLFSFADAASIEHSLRNDLTLYLNVHKAIASGFDNTFEALGNQTKPVIVIAHSLGCEQVSNYIWDAMNNKRFFKEPHPSSPDIDSFRRFGSCTKLITTGCNIPIFRAGLDNPELFERPNEQFYWQNYFDAHDVLGYPIRNMSDAYNTDWIHDKKVAVGGFLTGWNPTSHGEYWTDKDVVKPISEDIKRILTR